MAITSRNSLELLSADQEPPSSLTSDSDYTTDGEVAAADRLPPRPRPRVSRLSILQSHISEQVKLLYHYSAILRRPRLNGRYLHSKSRDDDEESSIAYYEYSHVRQKLTDWARSQAIEPRPIEKDFFEENQSIHEYREEELEGLCMRLARANTRRRQQLRYWSRHPFRPPGGEKESNLTENEETEARSLAAGSEHRSFKSVPTVRTFSSVAKSAIVETQIEDGPSRTVYATSAADSVAESAAQNHQKSRRIPKVSTESHLAPTFECPYCHMVLESAAMHDRMTWK